MALHPDGEQPSLPEAIHQEVSGGPTAATHRKRARVSVVDTVDLTVDEPTEPHERPTSSSIKFSNQGIEAHGLVALSKYFAAKMTTLDSYIPL